MKSKIKWIVIILVIIIVGYKCMKPEQANDPLAGVKVEVVEVARGDLRVVVEATGKVVANSTIEVKSKASGELLNLPYEEGEFVEGGTLLVELDPDDEQRNVERARSNLQSAAARVEQARSQLALVESDSTRTIAQSEANLRQARARFEEAQSRFDRRKELADQGVLSDEEMDTVRTQLEEALASYTNAQAAHEDAQSYHLNIELRRQDLLLRETDLRDAEIALEEAQERFEDTRILAPDSGVITDLQVEEGQIIASGISNVGGGTTLMVISDLSRMFIEVSVDETDIGTVKPGQECEVIADAYPEVTIPGHVDWIAPQGTDANNIVSFDVKVEIDLDEMDPDDLRRLLVTQLNSSGEEVDVLALRPNMTARVSIITADLQDVLLLKNEAIQRSPTNDRYVELVVEGASAEAVAMNTVEEPRGPRTEDGATATSGRPGGSRPTGGRPSGGRPSGGRPGGGTWNGAGGGGGEQVDVMAMLNLDIPTTVRRNIRLGASDGLNTHVVQGLSEGDEIYVPIPQWRLDFLRQQITGEDTSSNNRRRRGMF